MTKVDWEYEEKCETKYDTVQEQKCETVYDNQCNTVQEEKCETRYEDKCETKGGIVTHGTWNKWCNRTKLTVIATKLLHNCF